MASHPRQVNVVNNSQSGAKLALMLTPESGWHHLANTEANTHGDANFTGRTSTEHMKPHSPKTNG